MGTFCFFKEKQNVPILKREAPVVGLRPAASSDRSPDQSLRSTAVAVRIGACEYLVRSH